MPIFCLERSSTTALADEISMLLLSVGAHSRLGMSFSQFIEFYDKQAAISASENPSFEDSLDSFIAMGGRHVPEPV